MEELVRAFLSSLYGYSPLTIKIYKDVLIKWGELFSELYEGGFDILQTTPQMVEEYKAYLLQRVGLVR